ncbi:hypothetical protein [Parasitella parasitica]|uniref:Defective in cullin neddylation protein n=1 Tax=Parasitella parasitica TaxID=35722 RepID=A0A0B7NLK5_9FUNG|nr:hypothetical protein [Parasitella parasitica]
MTTMKSTRHYVRQFRVRLRLNSLSENDKPVKSYQTTTIDWTKKIDTVLVLLWVRSQVAQQQHTTHLSDSPNKITPDGNRQFFEDLGLSIEDSLIFAIAWKMHTSTMGYITKDEWMLGMKELETDTMEKLRAKRLDFEKVFDDPDQFKEMYKYTFFYAKNKDQKCMEIETALVLWETLLGEKYPIVNDFVTFLQEKKPVRVINRDQWQSFLEFASTDISEYDESSAWPVLFDEFVEWRAEK